ncbi:hypothetical protein CQY20_30155 [Mycolicibacterium agri]|uniref:Uncharacterized protein n=1 Tax=Mycolicibacterium agri TaxID=36811 RepID=A0A2A7MPC5_MYCAG|nr:hypothetical protein [Mycolicibacterium agri]PEG33546.1 hypothetical protein CQY20_30155 [Mycolicibacterium agri]GFG52951.1 hypothetical protein MAGR_43920 [Mycolicibacterium agri]
MRLATYVSTAWDIDRAGRQGQAGITRRQQQRLRELVSYVRDRSPYFADRYRDVPDPVTDVGQLPATTKTEMMRHFD